MNSRFVLEGSILALLIATAGCTKPSTDNGTAPGGSSGAATGGQTGATGASTGAGGANATGTGGSATGTGGSPATGTGGSTGATGGTTGAGGATTTGTGGAGGAIVQKDCATKTKLTNPAFMNFENYDSTAAADKYATAFGGATVNAGTAYAGVYAFGDGTTTPALSMMGDIDPALGRSPRASHRHPPGEWAVASGWDAPTPRRTRGSRSGSAARPGPARSRSPSTWRAPRCPTPPTRPAGNLPRHHRHLQGAFEGRHPPDQRLDPGAILWSDFAPGISGTASVVPDGNDITGLVWNVPLAFHLDPTVPADAAGPYVAIAGDLLIDVDDISFIP